VSACFTSLQITNSLKYLAVNAGHFPDHITPPNFPSGPLLVCSLDIAKTISATNAFIFPPVEFTLQGMLSSTKIVSSFQLPTPTKISPAPTTPSSISIPLVHPSTPQSTDSCSNPSILTFPKTSNSPSSSPAVDTNNPTPQSESSPSSAPCQFFQLESMA